MLTPRPEIETESVGRLLDRKDLARRIEDRQGLQIGQVIRTDVLVFQKDRHELVALAVFAQRVSLRGDGDAAGHLAAGDTDALALHLRVERQPRRNAVAPAVADIRRAGRTPHDLLGRLRQPAERVDIVADEPEFDRGVGHGRELEKRRAQPHVGTVRHDVGVETVFDLLGLFPVVQFDQDIAEIGAQRNAAAGQIVTRRRGAHRHRYGLHFGLRMEPLLHQTQVALRIADVIPFGQ